MAEPEPSDEELMRRLASGIEDSLSLLHDRYALMIFNIACPSLGRASAEEIVQDVFVVIWRKADSFDPSRGTFRSWALKIAHLRVINEFRRRSRRPRLETDRDGLRLASVPGQGPDPGEAAWLEDRRAIVRAAIEALPTSQRQALSLAFLEDLTHQQVAESLNLPLGTAKTRIRSGLMALRAHLSSGAAAGLLVVVLLAVAFVRDRMTRTDLERQSAALRLVTSSDVVPLRLANAPGIPLDTHGNYKGRSGVPLAVMTFSNFREAPAGQTYRAWGMFGGRWHLLGTVHPDSRGGDLLVIEGSHLTTLPSALSVTLESVEAPTAPGGLRVIVWPGQ
jgi:RNA polymerase sigma-70 factor, ECF subfamily